MTEPRADGSRRRNHVPGGLGVAVIGCGTIGTLRAKILDRHTSVSHLAVCDIDRDRARSLAEQCQANAWDTDARRVIEDPAVDAVIVATTEDAHFEPGIAALRAGKHLLVEKPFTIDPAEGLELLQEASKRDLQLYTGFTQRYRRRYLAAKEHLTQGYLGKITSGHLTIYLTQAVANAVISRAKSTSPSINTLTYCIDLLMWFLPDDPPRQVYAQGGQGRFFESHETPDSTWCVATLSSGAVVNLGVSWELPEFWPAYVASMRVELFGRRGTLAIQDDHRDVMLASSQAIPSPYTPDVSMPVVLLGSAMPGDWAGEDFFGAMKDETHAFVRAVGSGRIDTTLASGAQGVAVLNVSRAIDESTKTGRVVPVSPGRWGN